MRKLIKAKPVIVAAVIAALLLLVFFVIYSFPAHRIAKADISLYYDSKELSMIAYIGTPSDRSIGKEVLAKADAAFSDISHSQEENKETHGLLSRYSTSSERGAANEKHSLELWSAHFDSDSGYMWVYYSAATYDANGNPISQSADIPSLWTVEKNETGEWVVVGIKEHP